MVIGNKTQGIKIKNEKMKIVKYVFGICLVAFALYSCAQDDDNTNFVDNIKAPTNVSANVVVTQDNTGLVTITPLGEGVTSFNIGLGDESEMITGIEPGNSISHVYEEGTYEAVIVANGLNGLTTTVTRQIPVSFQAPQNLVVSIVNDGNVSNTVRVTATADFALSYEVDFGEDGDEDFVMANIGEEIVYEYQEPGIYTITVTAFSAAIETTQYIEEDFEVTAILAPIVSADQPPSRNPNDVISIFSDVYEDIVGTDFNPNWNQATLYSPFDLNGDMMLQYTNLNYQGIDIGENINASSMEVLHIDIWTPDATSLDIYPLPDGIQPDDERFVTKTLIENQWNSFDIPLSDFTSQGLAIDDLKQFKFVGSGTIFVDNLYFWKEPSVFNNLPVNFENSELTYNWVGFGNAGFGPIPTAIIANPDQSGINATLNVLEIQKTAGSQVWAGASMALDNPIDFINNGTTLTIKVWSPRVGVPILFKTEDPSSPPDGNGNPSVFAEVIATTTKANEWEELSFDMTTFPSFSTAINYENAIIFPDFGNTGQDETFYFDDIEFASLKFPINFEIDALTYEWNGFGDPSFGPIPTAIVTNPDQSGINESGVVLEVQKPAGSQVWAGASMTLDAPIDFTYGTTVKIKVWSPRAGVPILFKIEDLNSPPDGNGNPSVFVEIQGITNTENGWEEVTFDLTDAGAFSTTIEYGNAIVFPDFGNTGQDETFYFDDFVLTN